MHAPTIRTVIPAATLLTGLALLGAGEAVARPKPTAAPDPPAPPPDRVVLVSEGSSEYRALAIPKAYKTAPDAPLHLLVFSGGLCVRDHGLADAATNDGRAAEGGGTIVEQKGTTQRGYVAADGKTAVVVGTRYVSRVDVTPGQTSTANDTVTGDTTLTLVDPAHPDGRWRVTLENSRWVKDVVVIPGGRGVVVTTFVPRNGPADVRILDATGHETTRVPESSAETLRIETSPDGGAVGAEVTFRDNPELPERGVIVFDLARGTHWTYGWRYGSDAEPVSWSLQNAGVLAVKVPGATRRYDLTGRKL